MECKWNNERIRIKNSPHMCNEQEVVNFTFRAVDRKRVSRKTLLSKREEAL